MSNVVAFPEISVSLKWYDPIEDGVWYYVFANEAVKRRFLEIEHKNGHDAYVEYERSRVPFYAIFTEITDEDLDLYEAALAGPTGGVMFLSLYGALVKD